MPLGRKETKDTDSFYSRYPARRAQRCEEELQDKIKELDKFKRKHEVLVKTIEKIQFIKKYNPPTKEELNGYGNYEQRLLTLVHQIAYDGSYEAYRVI
jgi:hypothetical protein